MSNIRAHFIANHTNQVNSARSSRHYSTYRLKVGDKIVRLSVYQLRGLEAIATATSTVLLSDYSSGNRRSIIALMKKGLFIFIQRNNSKEVIVTNFGFDVLNAYRFMKKDD
jgi:hypothetical protein